ncbi:GntR family transcriptional regulator [Acidiphilium sp.]|uniref:GntR family transcriptional regulator n=1 Tax=Acidiphilium sp. TaxID=527 RepID=UPI00258EBB2A|nr:GntR family transcriptional regulator [Acidiphilium sp.]
MPRPRKQPAETGNPAAEDPFLASLGALRLDPGIGKTAQIYTIIRNGIVQLKLPPGAAINEREICARLGISRTPLREAILQLAAENLVTVVPSSGTSVAPIHIQDAFDGQMVRDALEMRVVRLAASRMNLAFERALAANMAAQRKASAARDFDEFYLLDEDFHRLISECGASPTVWRIINGAKAQLDRIRRLGFPRPHHAETVLAEHQAIFDGLMRRDSERAAAAMQTHLDRVFETVRLLIAERRDYFSPDAGEVAQRAGRPAGA